MVVLTSNLVQIFTAKDFRQNIYDTLSIGQVDRGSRSLVDIHSAYRMQKSTENVFNRRNIVPCKEIGVKESKSGVRIVNGN